MNDVVSQVNAVRRRIGSRALEAGEARSATLIRTYAAPVDSVWDACTNPERIPRWFLPVSGYLRPGGHYQLEGNAGGTVEHCEPPRSFTASWEYGDTVSWIAVRLSPDGDARTRLELEHTALVADDAIWARFGPGAVGVGWDLALMGLERHLSSGHAVDPAQAQAWAVSDEGQRFISLSSEGWRDAAIAAGVDRSEAQTAADRTTAFYTGADVAANS